MNQTLMTALLLGLTCVCAAAQTPDSATYLRLADQVEASLRRDDLDKFFPAAVDRVSGGFDENFGEDWSRRSSPIRSIVYQSRLTWLAAAAATRDPKEADRWLPIVRHGVAELSGKLWDREHGGFFWSVDRDGRPRGSHGSEKHVYGNAFGIYAAAAAYQADHDPAALELAERAFLWLDSHAHDDRHGGYFEALSEDGRPYGFDHPGADAIGTHYGYKSMNTHIHLLEALTELHKVRPDDRVTRRVNELLEIVRDRVCVEPGCQNMFFNPDWSPVPGMDSFGHDIETAYLMTEAAAEIGRADDPATWRMARHLVDHALDVGFDRQYGGFYEEGTTFGGDLSTRKIWWVQAEGLNALLLMHEKFGSQTPRYWQAFVKQWEFISHHQIDAVHGGWRPTVLRDGTPLPHQPKADAWTEGYHQGRAMLNVSARLRALAAGK